MNEPQTRRILAALGDHARSQDSVLLMHVVAELRQAIFGLDEQEGLIPGEIAFIQTGKKIEAIKALRGRFLGTTDPRGTLVGAKDCVEAYMSRHR